MKGRTAAPYLIAAAFGLILWGYGSAPRGESEAVGDTQGRVCLSAEVWSADDAERPCARIVRVWEDGSTQVYVAPAGGGRGYLTNTGARQE